MIYQVEIMGRSAVDKRQTHKKLFYKTHIEEEEFAISVSFFRVLTLVITPTYLISMERYTSELFIDTACF